MNLNIFDHIGHLRYWVDQHKGGINELWNEVHKLNGQVCEDGKWLKEQISNSEWDIRKRIDALEAENAELKKEVQQLRELAAQLSQLENMLINAVNQQLGDK